MTKVASKPEKPVGIITERDIVRIFGTLDAASLHSPLREIMSKPLVTISINGSIKGAIQQHQDLAKAKKVSILSRLYLYIEDGGHNKLLSRYCYSVLLLLLLNLLLV